MKTHALKRNFFFVVFEGQLEKTKFRNVSLHFAQEKGNRRISFMSKATIQNFLFLMLFISVENIGVIAN